MCCNLIRCTFSPLLLSRRPTSPLPQLSSQRKMEDESESQGLVRNLYRQMFGKFLEDDDETPSLVVDHDDFKIYLGNIQDARFVFYGDNVHPIIDMTSVQRYSQNREAEHTICGEYDGL